MTNVTASPFDKSKTKKFNYLKFQPKQNPKSERFFEKEQTTQEQKTTILRKISKTNLKQNFGKTTFQSRLSSERPTLSEKLKMTRGSRSKRNNKQTQR